MKSILVIVPHPDDEISLSGKVQDEILKGNEIHFLCLTQGEKGAYRNYEDKTIPLSERRKNEFSNVCRKLHAKSITILKNKDAGGSDWDQESIISKINKLIQEKKINEVYSMGNNINDHIDHLTTHKIILQLPKSIKKYLVCYPSYSVMKKEFWFLPTL